MSRATRLAAMFILTNIKSWRMLYLDYGLQPLRDLVILTPDPASDEEERLQEMVDWDMVEKLLKEELGEGDVHRG